MLASLVLFLSVTQDDSEAKQTQLEAYTEVSELDQCPPFCASAEPFTWSTLVPWLA